MLDETDRGRESPARSPAEEIRRSAQRLAGGFGVLVGFTWGLIVLGAMVRAHDAGLACPDWPLCFGEFVPRMNLKVGFEWTHRLVAASVALCFVVLATLVLRRPALRRGALPLLAIAAALLALQILLGALTVWQLLTAWTVTAHLVTGNTFAFTLLWIRCGLRERVAVTPMRPAPPAAARRWIALAALLLALQTILGGLVASRYAGLACPEWPTCTGGVWFPSWRGSVGIHVLHRVSGYALLAALLGAAITSRRAPGLRALTGLALGLTVVQVSVGVANVLLGLPVEITGLHTAVATAIVLTLSLAAHEIWLRPAGRA
jgi:cytochrome c oxidase assembly protein subunit 15